MSVTLMTFGSPAVVGLAETPGSPASVGSGGGVVVEAGVSVPQAASRPTAPMAPALASTLRRDGRAARSGRDWLTSVTFAHLRRRSGRSRGTDEIAAFGCYEIP